MEIASLTRTDAGAAMAPVSPAAGQGQGTAPAETGALTAARAVEKQTQQQETQQPQQQKAHPLMPTEEELKTMSAAMNRFVQLMNADLQFEVHTKTNRLMIKFVDTKENQVLKEFPPKDFLDMVASIRDYVGFVVDKKI